jgi:hypothetical protein
LPNSALLAIDHSLSSATKAGLAALAQATTAQARAL